MGMYDPHKIEIKWQTRWPSERNSFIIPKGKDPCYVLDMISYPSSDGLHMGHWRPYTIADVWARYQTMRGKHVLSPVGFDAFGLPAENAAIKTKTHPAEYTKNSISNFSRQIKQMGKMYDWSTLITTSDPSYYRWTQWLFLQLYKNGLAYRKSAYVNWCPNCQTVLANEQAISGRCERCDSDVIKKELKQWFLRITDFSEELLNFKDLNWPESVKTLQTNWIGKSEGTEIKFTVSNSQFFVVVFTTRVDTLFGATYLVLAPEHELVHRITSPAQKNTVDNYIQAATAKSDIERQDVSKTKTGVFTGAFAVNPINNETVPIWVADYVLASYGSGAIMAVPAHDKRDYEFAQKYDLPIRTVITNGGDDSLESPFVGDGQLVNSGQFSGMSSDRSIELITKKLEELNAGSNKVGYRLRDWLVSRQRYWGAPIPIVYCEACGEQPVPENDLPVVLPEDVEFLATGGSPLERHDLFKKTVCPKCANPASRETDTLDTFVDSSWYFLRFTDPKNTYCPYVKEQVEQWLPVDFYVGGAEHSILHLLYARFIMKALHRLNLVPYDEPFQTFYGNGMVYLNGSKMSKSKGNAVNPDDVIKRFGADALRGYILFMGPADQDVEWQENGIIGVSRFLTKVWNVCNGPYMDGEKVSQRARSAIRKIDELITARRFNRCISQLMITCKEFEKFGLTKPDAAIMTQLIAPFFPHIAEELWEKLGHSTSVFASTWPSINSDEADSFGLSVQINNKHYATLMVGLSSTEDEIVEMAQAEPTVSRGLEGKAVVKVIYVPGRTLIFIVK